MSWLEQDKSQNFHVRFRFGGTKFRRSLKTDNRQQAQGRLERLDENIRLVESGRLEIPPGADVPAFLLSDGKLSGTVRASSDLTVASLFAAFLKALRFDTQARGVISVASIQQDPKSKTFRIRFRFGGQRVFRSLKTKEPKLARSILGRVEETLRLIEQGTCRC